MKCPSFITAFCALVKAFAPSAPTASSHGPKFKTTRSAQGAAHGRATPTRKPLQPVRQSVDLTPRALRLYPSSPKAAERYLRNLEVLRRGN